MANIEIGQLQNGGLILDKPKYDLPPHIFTSAYNIDFTTVGATPAVKEQQVISEMQGTPIALNIIGLSNKQRLLLYFTETKIFYNYRGQHVDISRIGDPYSATTDFTWNGGFFNGWLVYTNGVDVPQAYAPTDPANKFSDLANWPATVRVNTILPFGNFLVGFGYNQATKSEFDSQTVFWSDVADPGTLPTWDVTDPASKAGTFALSQTKGAILGASLMGSDMIIYKEDSIWAMRYIGGTYVFSFEKRLENYGLISPKAFVSLGKEHFCVDSGKIYTHNGVTAQEIGVGVVKNSFFADINKDAKGNIFCLHEEAKNRIWIFYPSKNSFYCNKALIWNYAFNTWTVRDLPDTRCGCSGFNALYGYFSSYDSLEPDANPWNTVEVIYDDLPDSFVYDASSFGGTDKAIYLGLDVNMSEVVHDYANKKFSYMDITWYGASDYPPIYQIPFDGERKAGYLERTNLAIAGQDQSGNPTVDRTIYKTLTEFYPEVLNGAVQIRFGTQSVHSGTVDWSAWYDYDPSSDFCLFPFMTEKYIAIAFRSDPNNLTNWELTGFSLEIVKGGRY